MLVINFLLLAGVEAQTQIRLLDSHSRQPIEYASVFNAKGELLTASDSGGYVSLGENVHQFSISHVAYINKDVDVDTLKGKNLYLDLCEQVLHEVSVNVK